MELAEKLETGLSLSQLSPVGSSAFTRDPEARSTVSSSTSSEGSRMPLSSSEEEDINSIKAVEIEESPAQCRLLIGSLVPWF